MFEATNIDTYISEQTDQEIGQRKAEYQCQHNATT